MSVCPGPPGAGAISRLPVEVAGSVVLCALHCERAGPACVGFRAEGAAGCVLLSGLTAGRGGTFVRGCGGLRLAYRAVPPMPRPAAEAECAADGGRMAVPLSSQQRGCVQRVVDAAGAVPGFLPADAEHTDVAYVGLLVHEPTEYRTTDLRGAPVTVPDDAWEPGQPNDGAELRE
ncbi:hypothetical protein FJT64_002470 [Amphibalanus amphitrite]|uniref:Uncharacterized protein n=1 Tax=Amphibalanus amphitrite TaxID=1232801 RepID=A0A6A4WFA5_AMPAM|nr:hypothetical protein FJT64_002470 [Amphibalanus amphitrite]